MGVVIFWVICDEILFGTVGDLQNVPENNVSKENGLNSTKDELELFDVKYG